MKILDVIENFSKLTGLELEVMEDGGENFLVSYRIDKSLFEIEKIIFRTPFFSHRLVRKRKVISLGKFPIQAESGVKILIIVIEKVDKFTCRLIGTCKSGRK